MKTCEISGGIWEKASTEAIRMTIPCLENALQWFERHYFGCGIHATKNERGGRGSSDQSEHSVNLGQPISVEWSCDSQLMA